MGDPLERFEALIHRSDREYIRNFKIVNKCLSSAEALRRIIEEHRRATVTLTEEPCASDKLQ